MHHRVAGVCGTLFCAIALAAGAPRAQLERTAFDFGRISAAAPVQHDFRIVNAGDAPLRIEGVAMTPPLRLARMHAQIAAGGASHLRISLDASALAGAYEGRVIVFTNDPERPEITLAISGEVVPPIGLSPLPAVFLAATRGQAASATVDIVNQELQPLELGPARHATDRFDSRLEVLEAGQRYRLIVTLKQDGPSGRHLEEITVPTSSKTQPLLTIPAHTLMRERVYTFPDEIDLGALPIKTVREQPELLLRTAQILMVYQAGGRSFDISASTDIAGLTIRTARGPQGDRHQLTIALDPTFAIAPGPIAGSVFIRTNDPEFRELRVPVHGALLAD